MNFAALFALLLLPLALHAESTPLSRLALSQVAYLNLGDTTGGFFRSRIRITFRENLNTPAEVTTNNNTFVDDLGFEHTSTTLSLSGSPLVTTEISIDEVSSDGTILHSLAHEVRMVSNAVALPATIYDFYSNPLTRFNVPVSGGSFTITDATGKRALVTIDSSLQPQTFFDPAQMRYLQLSDAAVELNASFAFIPEGMNYSPGPVFSQREQAVPESLAISAECSRPGEQIEVSPLLLGAGLSAERIQICRAAPGGAVERSVLIRSNPKHEPADIMGRVYDAALRLGGQVAAAPLFGLSPEKISFANCHGYAILATLGASALPLNAYWLQSESTPHYTLGTQTLEPMLARHFQEILSVESSYYNTRAEELLAKNPRIHEGDFITFMGGGGFAHSGVIRKNSASGQWWIESKYEEGPVIDTPIAGVHNVIPNLYNSIRIFRKK